jgi:plastocyanin
MENQSQNTSPKNVNHPFNKKVIILAALAVAAILIMSIVAVVIDNNNDSSQSDTNVSVENSPTTEITIVNEGLSPSTINIKPGSQIQFSNNSDANIQIVQSPADELKLEDFDANEVTTKGGSYAYIFEDEGTFNIQDKNDPVKFNATITVVNQTSDSSPTQN